MSVLLNFHIFVYTPNFFLLFILFHSIVREHTLYYLKSFRCIALSWWSTVSVWYSQYHGLSSFPGWGTEISHRLHGTAKKGKKRNTLKLTFYGQHLLCPENAMCTQGNNLYSTAFEWYYSINIHQV